MFPDFAVPSEFFSSSFKHLLASHLEELLIILSKIELSH